jgi:hypothetical protein
MAIRKGVAQFLVASAKKLQEDRTKEQLGANVIKARVALANIIMPKGVKAPVKR